jgi:ABC-2 type transport system permease protein
VFFLLGFTLFSTMYAAIGAMVNSEQEAQQLQFLVAMPLIASVIVLVQILQDPATPLATWASIFPLTAPLIMFARIALDPNIPGWQIALSIGLLLVAIYGLLILCGRIYRIGILMYGKKPTLPEIMKWIKYA